MHTMLRKLLIVSTFLFVLSATSVRAENTQTCTQVTQYGGAVSYVCGAHTPVQTGIAENLALIGSSFVGASAILSLYLRKINKLA